MKADATVAAMTAEKAGTADTMVAAAFRDLGRMEYEACWHLQQTLFDDLVARKRARDRSSAEAAERAGGTVEAVGQATDKAEGNAETAGPAAEGSRCNAGAAGCRSTAGPAPANAGMVLFVEHPPVYTLGKSGHAENLLIDRTTLEKLGATFFHIDRGGDITFHGPGQIVCYPILDLEQFGIGLRTYIEALEEAVIRTVAHYGIRAGRIAGASGVWIWDDGPEKGTEQARNPEPERSGYAPETCAPRKICAIGVRSSRYVTMHGFALNVSTDLRWFSHINPCGFTDRGVTSIERETGRRIAMDEVKRVLVEELARILRCRIA